MCVYIYIYIREDGWVCLCGRDRKRVRAVRGCVRPPRLRVHGIQTEKISVLLHALIIELSAVKC